MTNSDYPWEPPVAGTEAEHLVGALDRLRTAFHWKADDLDGTGLQTRIGASSLTLAGLLKHLAFVEDYYFAHKLSGQPLGPPWDTTCREDVVDWEFTSAAADTPEQLYALWDGAVERSVTGQRSPAERVQAQRISAGRRDGRRDEVDTAFMRGLRSVPSRGWQSAAVVCAIAAAVALLVVPTGSGQGVSVDGSGSRTSDITHYTLLQSEGRSILLLLAVPIILTVIPLLISLRQRRTATLICTSLLSVGVVLAVMSIGVFFVPAVVCALVAIARGEGRAVPA